MALSDASVPAYMPAGLEHAVAAVPVAENTDIGVADAADHGEELRACHGLHGGCREAG